MNLTKKYYKNTWGTSNEDIKLYQMIKEALIGVLEKNSEIVKKEHLDEELFEI
jgi:hypothetical protein